MRFTGSLFAAAVALAAIATPALAADLGVAPIYKAPPRQPTFIGGDGLYIGLNTEMAVANGSISGGVFPGLTGGSITADGGRLGIDFGYIRNSCIMSTWCQVEVDAKWQNIQGGNSSGAIQSNWSVSGELDFGNDVIQQAFSTLGQKSPFPTFAAGFDPNQLLPAAVKTAGSPRGYFGGIVEAYGISGTAAFTRAGQTIDVAGGLVAGWRWQLLDAKGQPSNSSINAGIKYEWLNQGFDVTGLLASPGGAPPTIIRGGAQINTLAAAFLKVDFGVNSGL